MFEPAHEPTTLYARPRPISPPPGVACAYSPPAAYEESRIDLNAYLIPDRDTYFVLRASDEFMNDAGVYDEDDLIVNRARQPVHGDLVVAVVRDELTVQRLRVTEQGVELSSPDAIFPVARASSVKDLHIVGVVEACIQHLTSGTRDMDNDDAAGN